MKIYIGVDILTSLVHSAAVTAANVNGKHLLEELLHGEERSVYGDSVYASQMALIRAHAPQAKYFTNQRIRRHGDINGAEHSRNRNKSRRRARVARVFVAVKRLGGLKKVRYRGLEKNANRSFVAL